jgi:histidinol dehydrogenase
MQLINRVQAGSPEAGALFTGIGRRAEAEDAGIMALAAGVLADVQAQGWDAVVRYSKQFDMTEPYEITREMIDAAYERCDPSLRSALERAARNIEDYQRKLLPKDYEGPSPDGAVVGQLVRPMERVGVYVPGGTAAYPSTVLMDAIPAKIAGVGEIVMATPPDKDGAIPVDTLAAAHIAGVDRIFKLGGAQAVAALAYGTQSVPRVDKIIGPGNVYVATAKRMVYGTVDIDMIAGPSEILIIADDSANPVCVAADLLSQAEHDALSAAWLVTTSPVLAKKVQAEIQRRLETLPRREIAARAIEGDSAIVVTPSLEMGGNQQPHRAGACRDHYR